MTETSARYRHIYQNIPGWFDWESTYQRWARETPFGGTIVEVGVYQGKSLSYLLVELANLDRYDVAVHAVDSFVGPEVDDTPNGLQLEMLFLGNMEALRAQPTVHRISSQLAAQEFQAGTVDRVWLDAAHDDASVYVDLEVWWPRIRIGGEIGGHDLTSHSGVYSALTRWCTERRLAYQALPSCHSSGPVTSSWLMVKTRG